MAAIFEPCRIHNVVFRNRLLRSSVGGRMAHYDGTVSDVWKNFERRFAQGGVGGIISTTLNVNRFRESPMEYPPIAEDRFVPPLKRYIAEIKSTGVRYVIQIGDPGLATQTGLFADRRDSLSSSGGIDLVYGYNNRRTPMSQAEIDTSIQEFRAAARRVRDTGADGLEITASKGYLIHQFLNPGLNRRNDHWGGDADRRFHLLEEIVKAARAEVGRDFLFGIRLAAEDWNYLPLNLRLPPVLPLRAYFEGNTLAQTLVYAKRLKALGVDYLHIDSGFGFPHPRVTPGRFPTPELRQFLNGTRHLSFKAAARAVLVNLMPDFVANIGWKGGEAINLDYAATFRREVGLPVIANGGFQTRAVIEGALLRDQCDLVAMARALIANPHLPKLMQRGIELPARKRCSQCNRCVGRTATSPLGCYDERRFKSVEHMQMQIMRWNRPDPVSAPHAATAAVSVAAAPKA
jgi:2,4-dienoyl-CoA reductase (NADPH2)